MSSENSESKSPNPESTVITFISPLTIQAQMLIDNMDRDTAINTLLDPVLCGVFERLTRKILQFVSKNEESAIVPSDVTKVIGIEEMKDIQAHYFCSACNMALGNGPEAAAVHLMEGHKDPQEVVKNQPRGKKEKRLKVPKKLLALVRINIEKLVLDQLKIADKLKNSPLYDTFEKELFSLLNPIFPDNSIKIYKFGSRTFGLGTNTSDLDIYVEIDNSFNIFENSASKRSLQYIDAVCGAIHKNSTGWIIQYAVKKARVPILRLINITTELKCDIGFSNSLGYCNTKLLEYIFEVQPLVRHVCMALKIWFQRSGLSDSFSYYTLILMALFSFQMAGKLPSVADLQSGMGEIIKVGPWIGNFEERKLSDLKIEILNVNQATLKLYIFKFFEFFSNFNFDMFVISPYFGRLVEKKNIEKIMPRNYTNYVNSAPNELHSRIQLDKCVVLQDPFQLNHNIAKAITPSMLKVIKHFFTKTYEEALQTVKS